MKKLVLSCLVIFTFIAYSIHKNFGGLEGGDDARVIAPPALTTSSPTPTPTITDNSIPVPTQIFSTPVSTRTPAPTPKPTGQYKDGQYTGPSVNVYYGNVQVKAVISGGKITDVIFLDHPQDRQTSVYINSQAMPYLTQEAIAAQSANVNIISGATATSQGFIQSLGSALSQAAN